MANKRHKPEEIALRLRQVEVLVGQGKSRIDAIRDIRIEPSRLTTDGVCSTVGWVRIS